LIRRGYKKQQEKKIFYRTNERIFANSLRVLDKEGKLIGIMSKQDALAKAQEEELDLVEVAPTAQPPVAKIIDFNKFLYQQAKKKQEEKRKTKVTETKEVRLGPFMQGHDLDVMIGRARGFLEDSDKVRLVVKFNGRQITRPEFGRQVLQKVVKALSDLSKIEKEPRLEGRQLVTILAPERKTNAKEKDKEISQQTV
jgi:translation initiation factor IF-3